MRNRYEVRLSGSGGQGLILAGLILAEAAGIYDKRNVTQTQSYGPEARGGASKSEVVISESKIDYPKITRPDLLLALTQEACDEYHRDLREDGILIVDSFRVKRVPSPRAVSVPITQIAKKEVGKELVTNIVALGIITELTGVVSRGAVKKAVSGRVPKGTEKLNIKALEVGFRIGQEKKEAYA